MQLKMSLDIKELSKEKYKVEDLENQVGILQQELQDLNALYEESKTKISMQVTKMRNLNIEIENLTEIKINCENNCANVKSNYVQQIERMNQETEDQFDVYKEKIRELEKMYNKSIDDKNKMSEMYGNTSVSESNRNITSSIV